MAQYWALSIRVVFRGTVWMIEYRLIEEVLRVIERA